jgi:hypothetical protein
MKIVIPGGTGQIGRMLGRWFQASGHEVVALGRSRSEGPWRWVGWDGETLGAWAGELEGADVVIQMSGRSVNCRYNARNRAEILESRVRSTRVLGEAVRQCRRPPRVWLQSSTATIYAHRYDAANDEATGLMGGEEPGVPETWRFSVGIAKAWEAAALAACPPGVRLVLLRSAMTMSPDPGGVFEVMLGLVRKGLGGRNGDGRQFVSWIHERDFCRAIDWLIAHDLSGAVNLCAPNPLPNAEFMREFRRAWGIGVGLPAMDWMIEIGALFLRTESELILKSRRVVPGRLLEGGFRFESPDWPSAVRELCARWRAQSGR